MAKKEAVTDLWVAMRLKECGIPFEPKWYRYELTGSGGDYAYYNLREKEFTYPYEPEGTLHYDESFLGWVLYIGALDVPTDNEIRPVNVAVKYYIRAK